MKRVSAPPPGCGRSLLLISALQAPLSPLDTRHQLITEKSPSNYPLKSIAERNEK